MSFIPRPAKPPARGRLTCQVLKATLTWLKRYSEYMEGPQGYVIDRLVEVACRRDKKFHGWLAINYPGTRVTDGLVAPGDAQPHTQAPAAPRTTTPSLPDPRMERARA
jgi:hypothetical protein